MRNLKFTFSLVFSIMVLLVFGYFTFMGLVYRMGGNILFPAIITVVGVMLVLLLIIAMCLSRATRWQEFGIFGQVLFGILVFVILLSSSIPFTNFVRVEHDKESIYEKVRNTCNAATDLDKSYIDYVEKRIESYRKNLDGVSKARMIQPSKYNECLSGAYGNTDQEKIDNLSKSLKMKLLPESMDSIIVQRHNWLISASNASVWNPLTPANINKVDEIVNGWINNYTNLSSVTYKGEETKKFEYEAFSSNLQNLTSQYKTFQKPRFMPVCLSILCFFVMLLPYIMTRKTLAWEGSVTPIFE